MKKHFSATATHRSAFILRRWLQGCFQPNRILVVDGFHFTSTGREFDKNKAA
jgi:hypothetical protein